MARAEKMTEEMRQLNEQIERASWECDRAIAYMKSLVEKMQRLVDAQSGQQADELIKININPF